MIPIYSFSYKFGRLIKKTIKIYEELEEEMGQSVGWHKCGQLRVAESTDRMDEYLNYASIAKTQGVRAEILTPEEAVELWPLMKRNPSLLGAVYNADDGHIAPADVTQTLAKGARQLGATIHLNTEVNKIEQLPSGEWKVHTNHGDMVCEHVVTATGNYAQQTARMLGLELPCFPVLHQYWVTQTVPEVQERHREPDEFYPNAEAILAELSTCPPAPGFDQVEIPGERERATEQQRRLEGIPIPLPDSARDPEVDRDTGPPLNNLRSHGWFTHNAQWRSDRLGDRLYL